MATRITGPAKERPRIIVDCTHTFHTGAGTGIQRVVRRYADSLLAIAEAEGIEVIPARVTAGSLLPLPIEAGKVAFPRSESARESMSQQQDATLVTWRARGHRLNRLLGSPRLQRWLDAGPNEAGLMRRLNGERGEMPGALALRRDDILLSLDSSWVYDIRTVLEKASRVGMTRISVLCDVLPLSHPEFFTEGTRRWFAGWLEALLPRLDGVITISEATRQELLALAAQHRIRVPSMPQSRAVHLGAEIEGSAGGMVRAELREAFKQGTAPAFLTVGTLEPRKNVDFALDLFDVLREWGLDVQWHVVGAAGWMAEQTAQRIQSHPAFNRGLYWWTNLNDAELAWCYAHARALVAVSKAEGFGLPLVEARLHGLPVFAADIAVFREVLGGEGRFMPLSNAQLAAAALGDFLSGALPVPGREHASRIAASWIDRSRELLECLRQMQRHSHARTA